MCRLTLNLPSVASAAVLVAAVGVTSPALAADAAPSLDLRGFRAPTDPDSGLYLEPASSPDTFDWSSGLWLSYVRRSITLRDPETEEAKFAVLRDQLTGDFTASIGFRKRVALGLEIPFLLYQAGDDPTDASTRVLGDTPLPQQALGDLGVTGKLTIVQPRHGAFGGFALAVHERLTVPTGNEASYLGEGHVTSETRLLSEYRLVALGVHVALGVKLRGEHERFACAATPTPSSEGAEDACPTRFGHELPFGLGLSFRPQALGIDSAGRWTWFVESRGHLPLSPVAPFSSDSGKVASLSVSAGARVRLGDMSILASAETSLLESVGASPIRGVLSVGWAPRAYDIDGDGIEDDRDLCRELAEDRDNFEDDDGCPDGDNDDDGVPDGEDRCASEAEDEDGFEDEDGCIDPDNDGDTILDAVDACPNEAGILSKEPAKNGCPLRDPDGDGIEGDKDKCPDAMEDKDGFEDEDGCAELDNDADGIPDVADACPITAGIDSPNAKEKGCPDPDRDRDTLSDAEDKCPDEAEVWNGLDDADGCADADPKKKLKPLVTVKEANDGPVFAIAAPLTLTDKADIDPGSIPVLRALASELLKHPEWSVAVGVRPKPKSGEEDAKAQASALVSALQSFTRRETSAKAVGWAEVKDVAGASARGIGLKIIVAKAGTAAPTKKAAEGEQLWP